MHRTVGREILNVMNWILFSESLSLELDNNHEIVDHEIINLVNNCRNLKELSINAIISIATVEQICELQKEGKIGELFVPSPLQYKLLHNLVIVHNTIVGIQSTLFVCWACCIQINENF